MNLDGMLDAIGGIYDAAVDSRRLAAIGGQAARLIGAGSALVFVARKRDAKLTQLVSMTGNFDDRARSAYNDYFHRHNEWFQRGARLPSPVVVLGGELIDYPQFERTEFWNDWCRPVGIYHTIGSTYPIGDGSVMAMGIYRGREAEPFGEAERQIVSTILPHLARVMQIAERIGTADRRAELTDEILFGLGVGLVLLDADRNVLLLNRIAERMVRKSRWLTATGKRLRAIHPASATAFEGAVDRATATGRGAAIDSGEVVVLRDPLAPDLPVLVTPFRAPFLGETRPPAAAMLFSDPDARRAVSASAIAQSFALTRAEAQLVAALVGGTRIADYASDAGISFHTARAQLRAVFAKTGITRQPDLVAAVLSDLAVRLSDLDPG